MQFLGIVFFCKFLRKKNGAEEKHVIFLLQIMDYSPIFEKIRGGEGGVHSMEIFAMKILLVLLMLDFQFRLLKTPFMDRYLHNAMGFKGDWFFFNKTKG